MRLIFQSALVMLVTFSSVDAHDAVSPQYLTGEQAIADLEAARDNVLSTPDTSGDDKEAAKAYVATAFVWNKTQLSVCFWQTDQPNLLQGVADQANLWSKGTKIKFDFGKPQFRRCADEYSADIRVTLNVLPLAYYFQNDQPLINWDWSEYGSLPAQVRAKVSMSLVHAQQDFNLAKALGETKDFDFLIAHEFGHALGLMHEHQRIDCSTYLADKQTVMHAYKFKTDADYDSFVANVKQIPMSDPALRPRAIGSFDVESVMLYNFPQVIWKTGINNPCARPTDIQHPDENDIAAVNYLYGVPPPAPVAVRGGSEPPAGAAVPRAVGPLARPDTRDQVSAATNDEAKKKLENSYKEHTKRAAQLDQPPARGGGDNTAARHQEAEQNRNAATKIQLLLDAMKRVNAPNTR